MDVSAGSGRCNCSICAKLRAWTIILKPQAVRLLAGESILREAHVMAAGNTLGPVGGRIVGEVLIGLMQLNRNSYLRASPGWRPTLFDRFGRQTSAFKMVDFLTFVGVAPGQRGQ